MFRCKECQTEYKIKPDYCDCGNDTFDEIIEHSEIKKPEPKPEPVLTPKEKVERKPKRKSQIDPFGWIIFAFCMILSFVIVFFVGNPKDEPVQETKEEIKVDTSYIPKSTNAFWDNTVKQPEAEPVKEEVKKVIEQIIPKAVQPKPTQNIQKSAQSPQKQVQKATSQTKPQTQKTAQTTTPKTTSTPVKQTNVQLPKSITDITNKSHTTQTTNTPATVKPVQTATTPPKAEPKKLNQQEYSNYKINLRNTIASKINFAGVIGDGDCVVSFSISNNGTLINRKFEKQSTNNTLNDAVYHAIMQTPGFKNPPEGYNGQTMRFTVKMYSGNFEVTLN